MSEIIKFYTTQTSITVEQKCSEQSQLYDYLMMKFIHLYRQQQFLRLNQHPQLKQLCRLNQNQRNILDLFYLQRISTNKFDSHKINERSQYNDSQKLQFLTKLIEKYPIIFFEIVEQNITWEVVIFNVVKKGCLQQLINYLVKNQFLDKNSRESLEKVKTSINILIASLIINDKMTYFQRQKSLFFNLVQQKLLELFKDRITKYSTFTSFEQKTEVINKAQSMIIQELNWIFGQQNEQDNIFQTFQNEFQDFIDVFKYKEIALNQNVFKLHYIDQFLSNSYKIKCDSILLMRSNDFDRSAQQKLKLKVINFFNIKKSENKQQIIVNHHLLKSFINTPYRTCLFVLHKFLSHSDIKYVERLFNNSKSQHLIDPLLFLLTNRKLIDNFNVETFSISIWIVTEVWLKYTQGKLKQYINSRKDYQKKPDQQLTFRDPRKIYTIKHDSYPSISSSCFNNSQTSSNSVINSLQDFENHYKRPLMYTIVLYLLTLDVETTMLKYFPIQNDIIKEMVQGDLLPYLLVKNQYNSQKKPRFSKHYEQEAYQFQKNEDLNFMKIIENAESLQELEKLQKQYLLKNNSISRNCQEQNITEVLSKIIDLPLPWMHVIESKQFLFPLLSKPAGYELALKIIEKSPNAFIKLYENYLPKMIFAEIDQKKYLEQMQNKQNNSSSQGYLFKGNKNINLKKTIDHTNEKNTQIKHKSTEKSNASYQGKLRAMKEILKFYKQNSQDQILRKTCSKYFQLL